MNAPASGRMAVLMSSGSIEMRQVRVPELQEDQVLIKVRASAICGSDLHMYRGIHPFASLPSTFGHELSGDVVRIGEKVKRIKVADRVCVEPLTTCENCYYCLRGEYDYCENLKLRYKSEGAFSDYYTASEKWIHKLGAKMSYDEGCLMEPLSVAVHAAGRSRLTMGSSAAIFGDGAIGLMLLEVVKGMGTCPIILVGTSEKNLELAKSLGATAVVKAQGTDPIKEILKQTNGLGVDGSFEAVGLSLTFNQAIGSLKTGGRAVIVGLFTEELIPADLAVALRKEKEIVGTTSYRWDFERAINLVQNGIVNLKPLITHIFPLSELQTALETKSDLRSDAVKVIVHP